MAKELPFFKFIATEWLTGDINFEPFDIQGLFINVCATYWKEDCVITLTRLKQRLSNAEAQQWKQLIDGKYIKVINDQVYISFLDEQLEELGEQRKKKQEAGRKGGKASLKQRLSNAKATLKHKDIDIEVDTDKDVDSKIPSLSEVEDYFDKNGYTKESAKKMFDYYESSREKKDLAWKDGKGNIVNNWKQKAIAVWFKDENLKKPSNGFTFDLSSMRTTQNGYE